MKSLVLIALLFLTSSSFAQRVRPNEFLRNQLAFGGSFGTPGGLNFIAEGYYEQLGIRFSGGGIPISPLYSLGGFQGDLCLVLDRSRNSLFESIIVAKRQFETPFSGNSTSVTGYGVGIAMNYGGLFFEVDYGYTVEQDLITGYTTAGFKPWPIGIQIGYVH